MSSKGALRQGQPIEGYQQENLNVLGAVGLTFTHCHHALAGPDIGDAAADPRDDTTAFNTNIRAWHLPHLYITVSTFGFWSTLYCHDKYLRR